LQFTAPNADALYTMPLDGARA